MDDEKLRRLLKEYVEEEMSVVEPEKLEGFDHVFSEEYQEKMKKVVEKAQKRRRRAKCYRACRRAAVAAVLLLSLLIVQKSSANMFGIRTWGTKSSYNKKSKMLVKRYIKPDGSTMDSEAEEAGRKVKRKRPSYIPEGMEEDEFEENSVDMIITWTGSGGARCIIYSRSVILDTSTHMMDAEYESEREVVVAGYQGTLYRKKGIFWISWDDWKYTHYCLFQGFEDEEEEGLKVVQSLY